MTQLRTGSLEYKELNQWVEGVYKDPRARKHYSQLDVMRQATLLRWAQSHAALSTVSLNVNDQQCASGYCVMFGKFQGKSVSSLVDQGKNPNKHTNNGAGWWLLWVCGVLDSQTTGTFKFQWDKVEHIRLFVGLWSIQARHGTVYVLDNNNAQRDLPLQKMAQHYYDHCFRAWMQPDQHKPLDPDDEEGNLLDDCVSAAAPAADAAASSAATCATPELPQLPLLPLLHPVLLPHYSFSIQPSHILCMILSQILLELYTMTHT
jgi:hypothetical protein